MTKLDDAIGTNDLDYIRKFLENGGDPNTVVTMKRSGKLSLLNGLISLPNDKNITTVLDTIKLAFKKGADANGIVELDHVPHTHRFSILKLLVEHGFNINTLMGKGDYKHPFLFWFAGNIDILQYFLENGGDINARGYGGRTILHNWSDWCIKMFELCENYGVDFKAVDNVGCSILHYWATEWLSRPDGDNLVKFLLDKGLDINVTDNSGATALYYYTDDITCLYHPQRCYNGLQGLLKLGADLSIKTKGGETALYVYCRRINNGDILSKIARLFITYGLDVNSKDSLGRTVLHESVLSCEVFDTVLEFPGIDLNVTNNNGDTPLILAVKHNKIDHVRSLVKKGAKLDIANKEGKTAHDISRELNAIGIVKVLANKLYSC